MRSFRRMFGEISRHASIEWFPQPGAAPGIARPAIYFDRGSSDLQPRYLYVLHMLARQLRDCAQGGAVVVEGHANPGESERDALALSRRRAETVARALAILGIPRRRIAVVPRGSRTAKREAAACVPAWNRRVELSTARRPRAAVKPVLPRMARARRIGSRSVAQDGRG